MCSGARRPARRTMSTLQVAQIVALVRSLAEDRARRSAMIDALALDGGISAPMAEWALHSATARYTRDAAVSLASRTDLPDLAGARIAVMLADSVPIAPLRAIVLPLIRSARELRVRTARRQPRVA